MKVVYVAGAYRSGKGEHYVLDNILKARDIARQLWLQGYAVICPHANTLLMGGDDIPDSTFLKGDLLFLERADMVVMLPGWGLSKGATAEFDYATALGKEVRMWSDDQGLLNSPCPL